MSRGDLNQLHFFLYSVTFIHNIKSSIVLIIVKKFNINYLIFYDIDQEIFVGILCHLIEVSTLPLRLCINIVLSVVCIIIFNKKTSGKV